MEVVLNAVWLVLGLLASGAALRGFCLHRASARARALRLLCVALVLATVFPYISATDDMVRVEQFRSHQDSRHPAQQNQSDHLIRLYQVMDAPLTGHFFHFLMTFVVLALVSTQVCVLCKTIAPFVAGRSPPVSALARNC